MSDIIKVDFGTGQVVERETVTVPEPVQERLDRARTVAEVLGLEKPR